MKKIINENIVREATPLIGWLSDRGVSRKAAGDAVETWQAREGEDSMKALAFFILKNRDMWKTWGEVLAAMNKFTHADYGRGEGPGTLKFLDDAWTLPQPSGYAKKLADDSAGKETMAQKEEALDEALRRAVTKTMQEVAEENGAQKLSPELSEPKHLSEVRMHVRNTINEMMVGMTPITRMNTQGNANTARNGNITDTGVNKAAIGFNTFDMQEWASIAGITEGAELKEHWADDGYGSNVVDLRDPASDEIHEIPGMISPELPEPEPMPAPCGGCETGSCDCHSKPGPVTGDVGHSSEVGDMDLDFERFLSGLELQDDAGVERIGAAAEEGDMHYEDEYADEAPLGRG